ncbi:MAG TPA: hypothetical protein PLV42_05435 [bacterium]|nr:hypothetical protein [bacterium]
MREREIVHINVSHFMAAVEETLEPRLKGRPCAVARDAERAVIFDVSEVAFRAGLRKGMFLRDARRMMRDLTLIEPKPLLYARAQQALFETMTQFSPLIEQQERGHFFIDASGTRRLFGPPGDLAARIRREVKEALSLTPSTGHAANKLVAKVATRVVKPDGFASIPHGGEASFLSPQEVELLPGVGPKIARTLTSLGVETLGTLAGLTEGQASAVLGRGGVRLRLLAAGVDDSPVLSGAQGPTVRVEAPFPEDSADPEELSRRLFDAVEEGGMQVRFMNRGVCALKLEIWYADGLTAAGSEQFPAPLTTDRSLFLKATLLAGRIHTRRVRVKQVAVTFSKLSESVRQLDLFIPPDLEKEQRLQEALDTIRRKYDLHAVRYGRSLG